MLYCPLPELDGGAIGKELRHAIEGGFLQTRREEDDANVIYRREAPKTLENSHGTLFVHNFNETRRVRRIILPEIKVLVIFFGMVGFPPRMDGALPYLSCN